MSAGTDQLKHIVVLMMENRSFDHMLGYLMAQDPRIDGVDGTQTNPDTTGVLVPVQPLAQYQSQLQPDPGHHFEDVKLQIHGDTPGGPPMQGFIKAYLAATTECESFAQYHAVFLARGGAGYHHSGPQVRGLQPLVFISSRPYPPEPKILQATGNRPIAPSE
jgi:hypothetical protein